VELRRREEAKRADVDPSPTSPSRGRPGPPIGPRRCRRVRSALFEHVHPRQPPLAAFRRVAPMCWRAVRPRTAMLCHPQPPRTATSRMHPALKAALAPSHHGVGQLVNPDEHNHAMSGRSLLRRRATLPVIVLAGAVFAGCGSSPPSSAAKAVSGSSSVALTSLSVQGHTFPVKLAVLVPHLGAIPNTMRQVGAWAEAGRIADHRDPLFTTHGFLANEERIMPR